MQLTTEALIIDAIKTALGTGQARKHLELWRSVSKRYPDVTYNAFDKIMGALEMDETIVLTGSRGPNTYKLAK